MLEGSVSRVVNPSHGVPRGSTLTQRGTTLTIRRNVSPSRRSAQVPRTFLFMTHLLGVINSFPFFSG